MKDLGKITFGKSRPAPKQVLVLDRMDSKGQTEEALSNLRLAIDGGARFVLQGNSSATAAALIDADPKPMLECWQIRRTTRQLAFAITDPVVENYIGFVQQLLAFLDRAPETDSTNINLGAREAPAAPAPH